MTRKEQIIEIITNMVLPDWNISPKNKYYTLCGREIPKIAEEIESLFQQEYLNSCIERATPGLSKIKDVDKELADIRGENNCNNCKWGICLTKDWPCNDCNGRNKWEPIK